MASNDNSNQGTSPILHSIPTEKRYRFRPCYALIAIVLYGMIFSFNWHRIHYGVETGDEAFHIAEAYIVSNGAIPFTNNWFQSPGFTLFTSALVKLYTSITSGTEGIFLFMRQAFLIFKMVVAWILFMLFKRRFPLLLSLLLPLPYLALSIFNISSISYFTLSVSFLLLSCASLFVALDEKEKHARRFSFLSGVLAALTILVHPLYVFSVVCVCVFLLCYERKQFKFLIRSSLFIIGGLATGIIVTVYLAIKSGGIMPIFHGISNILYAPYFYLQNHGLSYYLSRLMDTGAGDYYWRFIILAFIGAIGFSFFCYYILYKQRERLTAAKKKLAVTLLYLQIITVFLILFYVYSYSDYSRLIFYLNVFHTFIMILLFFTAEWKRHILFLMLTYFPFLVNFIAFFLFHYGPIAGFGYMLFPSTMLCISLTYYVLESTYAPDEFVNVQMSVVKYAGVVALTSVFCLSYIIAHYSYVWNEAPISQLHYKMEKGVFKGLYTAEERGSAIIFLEDEIMRNTSPQDTVLFMDLFPAAYLMTQAEHCAPSTWDLLHYNVAYAGWFKDGFDYTDDSLLHRYFEAAGKIPSKIIYIYYREHPDRISLSDDNFKFNKYVEQHYAKVYTNDKEMYAIVIYERIIA